MAFSSRLSIRRRGKRLPVIARALGKPKRKSFANVREALSSLNSLPPVMVVSKPLEVPRRPTKPNRVAATVEPIQAKSNREKSNRVTSQGLKTITALGKGSPVAVSAGLSQCAAVGGDPISAALYWGVIVICLIGGAYVFLGRRFNGC